MCFPFEYRLEFPDLIYLICALSEWVTSSKSHDLAGCAWFDEVFDSTSGPNEVNGLLVTFWKEGDLHSNRRSVCADDSEAIE